MPKGDKYFGLKNHLQNSNNPQIRLSFEEIEKIIGALLQNLQPNMRKHGGQIIMIIRKQFRGWMPGTKQIT